MPSTVVYDACVLNPAPLRDTLIWLARAGLFRARWTDRILDETFRAIQKQRPDLPSRRLERTRALMCMAVADCLVTGYEVLIPGLTLPDPDDRHVLAAAIRCGAQVIVTNNLGDFPAKALEPHSIEAQTPDEFVLRLVEVDLEAVVDAVKRQAASLRSPPRTFLELLETLERNGLAKSVAEIRRRVAPS